MSGRPRVGVLFGGASEEHDVSVRSARQVGRCLNASRYELVWVGISRDGEWRLCDGPEAGIEGGRQAVLAPDRSVRGLLVRGTGGWEALGLDVVLPLLHGEHGEDGAVQGLLQLSGVPYVGCDVQSSVLCMDKSLAYLVARSVGVATPRFEVAWPGEPVAEPPFPYPVFVKPARSGSSFGVSKVSCREELAPALAEARRYDAKVLVEEAVDGSEVGCAVLGTGRDLVVGEVDQVALAHGFFRIHQEDDPESGSENATHLVPAQVSDEERARVVETAKALYRALGCRGLARVDLFLKRDGKLVLNEVNTMPGMTSYSRYPRMMDAAGLPLGEVLDRLIASALAGGSR